MEMSIGSSSNKQAVAMVSTQLNIERGCSLLFVVMRTATYGPQKTQSLKIKREKKLQRGHGELSNFPLISQASLNCVLEEKTSVENGTALLGWRMKCGQSWNGAVEKGNEKKRQTKLSMEVIIIEEKTSEGEMRRCKESERMSVPQKKPENII